MVVVENSIYFLGNQILTGMGEPVLTKALMDYRLSFVLPDTFNGQTKWDFFDIDIRNTMRPYIGNGYADFWFTGETFYQGEGCSGLQDNGYMGFKESTEKSQLVISESAANCMLNQWARSHLGVIDLNEERFNKFFKVEGYKMNTSTISQFIKIFKDQLGPGLPLQVFVAFENFKLTFGLDEADVILTYTLKLSWRIEEKNESIFSSG